MNIRKLCQPKLLKKISKSFSSSIDLYNKKLDYKKIIIQTAFNGGVVCALHINADELKELENLGFTLEKMDDYDGWYVSWN